MDTLATTRQQQWETALGRSALYAFVTRLLAYPSDIHRLELEEVILPVIDALHAPPLERLIAGVVDRLEAHPWDSRLDEARAAHGRLFPPVDSQDCPAYETAYIEGGIFRQAAVMADVAGFYRAHGLEVGGVDRERPDHIVTELEFMSFMARKEAFALDQLGRPEVEECRRTQRSFLRDHLGCWAPAFGVRLARVAQDPLYPGVGLLVAAWVSADMEETGVQPAEVLAEPVAWPVPDDGTCGLEDTDTGGAEFRCSPTEGGCAP